MFRDYQKKGKLVKGEVDPSGVSATKLVVLGVTAATVGGLTTFLIYRSKPFAST